MGYSQAKVDAYAQLDAAVDAVRQAYKDDDPDDSNDVLVGWVLLTTAVEFCGEDTGDDPLDTRSIAGWYSKRGQHPVLSYGIVQEGLRHYNDVAATGGAG